MEHDHTQCGTKLTLINFTIIVDLFATALGAIFAQEIDVYSER
jgi:hypothetical protein